MKSILVIERDGALQKILKRLFSAEEYEVDVVADGTAGLEMLRQRTPVAVILDIERSGNSECDLCKKIAKSIPNTPLVILSASSDAADKVLFLGMGADDYGFEGENNARPHDSDCQQCRTFVGVL
jgi:two-component system alkaline phosphatase synthesis response regulator PhoP